MVSPTNTESARNGRTLVVLLGLFVLALLPRAWQLGALGLDHFDEGGYATTAQALAAGEPDDHFPLQHFLAPPVYYGLASLGMRLGAEGDLALFLLNVLLGALTAPVVFLFARRSAGDAAAAGAAVLVALSSLHVLFSRAALTDVGFALFFVVALGALACAERRRSLGCAVVAGLCVGLAWNTKYHGWLAIPLFGLACVPAFVKADMAARKGTVLRLVVSGAVAGLCFLPWFLHVQSLPGGYARLTEEHRSFLDGLSGYLDRALLHVDAGQYLVTGFGLAAWPLALLVAGCLAGECRRGLLAALCIGIPLALAARWIGSPALLGALAAVSLVHAVVTRRGLDPPHVVFALVFAALVPLYHFYARLSLPAVLGGALLVGHFLGSVATGFQLRRQGVVGLVVGFLCLAAHLVATPRASTEQFFQKDSLRASATGLGEALSPDMPVAVIGEPPLVFYLRAAGYRAEHLNSPTELSGSTGLFEPGTRLQLVLGRYARWTGEWDDWREAHAPGLEPRRTFPAQVGEVRLLDDAHPWEARRLRALPDERYQLELFELVVP